MPDYDPNIDRQLEAPMPWIGTYAAIASTLCTLLMATDVFRGFRTKKYWFPSKYFALNATSLTVLAVSMKLPLDLTTKIYSVTDRLAKVSSLAFMSIAMANFMTSLGSMEDKSLFMNVVALAILVATITGNVCIQIIQMRSYLSLRRAFWEESLALWAMLVLLVMCASSALTILSTKNYLETRYRDMHNSALDEEELVDMRRASTRKLRVLIRKYCVMAETSSPQFVIARSVTSTVSGLVSVIIALLLMEAELRIALEEGLFDKTISTYKESTRAILLAQTIGVIVGTVAPISRWLITINHRASTECRTNIVNAFRVEAYWTQKLVEWRRSSLPVDIKHLKSRKALHNIRGLILTLTILLQNLIVLVSKVILAVSIFLTRPIKSCLDCTRRSRRTQISDSGSQEVDIRRYVIQLEGEVELSTQTLRNIFKEVDEIIKKGNMMKPKNLLNLLSKSSNFKGVTEFDSPHIPNLLPQELPYCWSLPITTLACIALAIPKIGKEKSESLQRSVTEGLRYVKLVDKLLDKKGRLAKTRTAADAVSVEAELHGKWQNKNLEEISVKGKNAEETLQKLNENSKNTVDEFKTNPNYCFMQNHAYWPSEIIAANSMYRVSKTILISHGGESDATDEQVFERLAIIIADIMAACLTNLPRAITIKCHRCAIEKREGGVRKAAMYLGETEEIIELLQRRELPILDPVRAAHVEEWRALIGLESKDKDLYEPSMDHVAVNMED